MTENITIVGDGIKLMRLLTLKAAVKLEIKGLKRHGRPATSIVRQLTGCKSTNKIKVLESLEQHIATNYPRPQT